MRYPLQSSKSRVLLMVAAATAFIALVAACQPVRPVDGLERPPPAESTASTVITDAPGIEAPSPLADTNPDIDNSTPTPDPALTDADLIEAALIEAGLQVYHAQYCGICHVLGAAGTTGTFGPSHEGVASVAAERIIDARYSGSAVSPAEYLYESLIEPKAFVVDGYVGSSHSMPPYTHLSEEELQALVALLMAQTR